MTDIVASLAVEIGANIGGLRTGLRQANNEINGIGGRLQGIGDSIQNAGMRVSAALAPVTIAFGVGLAVASDFEGIMAEIGARAGLTADELDQVSAFALQMGADTAFSGQEAADALLQLMTSGQSVEEAMATLPAVMDAAAASGEDLGMTADMVTDIMAQFGLDVEDAESIVNSLAQAAGASSADIGSLGQGFGNVGVKAALAGLTVEQTAAALAILAENGIKGAEAGTALGSMLHNMNRDTDTVQGAWNELGISLYDAQGIMRPLPTVLEEINTALADRSPEEARRLMTDLFGSYGLTAGAALLGSISIDEMVDSMHGQASASLVAAARMNTFEGRIDSLKGSLETLAITTLTPFMKNTLAPLAEQLTHVVNGVTDWANENPSLTGGIVVLGGILAVVGPALVAVGTAIKMIGVATSLASGAIGGLTLPFLSVLGPIAAVGVAIAGVVLALDDFNTKIEKSKEIGTAGGAALSVGAPGVFQTEQEFNDAMFAGLAEQHGDLYARYIWGTATFQTALISARDEYFRQALERANSVPMGEINAEARMGEIGNGMIGGWGDPEATAKPMGNLLGIALGEGVSEGLATSQFNAETAMQNMVNGVNDTATSGETGWGIDSPSTVFQGYGLNIVEGLALGISQNVGLASNAIGLLTATLEAGWKKATETLNKLTPGLLSPLNKLHAALEDVAKAAAAAMAGITAVGATGGNIPGRALGGPVAAGQAYIVGERGPELFMPGRSGSIVPNHRLGGGSTILVNAYGESPHELARLVEMAMRERDL